MRRAALVLALALAACEVPLDPIEPSDFAFSLSGYLDVSADTQWVRVESVAESILISSAPLDVTVSLAGPGVDATLTQRVQTFDTGPAHLFWTTAPIAPGATYRLTVRAADGQTTATSIRVPEPSTYTVLVDDGPFACPTRVTVLGAERVVDVQARYTVLRDGRVETYRVSSVASGTTGLDGSQSFQIYPGDDAVRANFDGLRPPNGIVGAEIAVAIGTSDWPETSGRTIEDLLFDDSPLVEGGVGFVGGAITEQQPFTIGVIAEGFSGSRPCTTGGSF